MPPFAWKGTIQFGLVNVAVKAKSAIVLDKIALQMLHKDCGGAAGYRQDWYCGADNESITRADTVKGYNGRVVDEAHIKSLKKARGSMLEMVSVVDADEIDPRYYEQSYDVTPDEGAEKVYKLFATTLAASGKVAIFKGVLTDREQLVAIRPRDGILAMETMYWPDDLTRGGRDEAAREAIKDVVVSEAEMKMGEQLITMLSGHFDPSAHKDGYTADLRAYLKSVEDGTAAPVVTEHAAAPSGVDLMAALQASLEAAAKASPEPVVVGKKGKKVA